jgi:hypothetical protein
LVGFFDVGAAHAGLAPRPLPQPRAVLKPVATVVGGRRAPAPVEDDSWTEF